MPNLAQRLLLLSTLAITTLPFLASAAEVAAPLRVTSFNVRLPAESDGPDRWEARKDLFVATVKRLQPDVMGTQELWQVQGDYVTAQLPQYSWFGRGRRGDAGDEHMGVFYRKDTLKVVESGDFWLSDTPDVAGSISWGNLYPRMVTWALFERIGDGRRFYFFNTHLPYRDQDEPARERGAALLRERIDALPKGVPVVITGDFNTTPDTRTHALLAGALSDAWDSAGSRQGPAETFHAFKGKADRRIDWVFVRGLKARTASTDTQALDGHFPSDHFPVSVLLDWPVTPAPR